MVRLATVALLTFALTAPALAGRQPGPVRQGRAHAGLLRPGFLGGHPLGLRLALRPGGDRAARALRYANRKGKLAGLSVASAEILADAAGPEHDAILTRFSELTAERLDPTQLHEVVEKIADRGKREEAVLTLLRASPTGLDAAEKARILRFVRPGVLFENVPRISPQIAREVLAAADPADRPGEAAVEYMVHRLQDTTLKWNRAGREQILEALGIAEAAARSGREVNELLSRIIVRGGYTIRNDVRLAFYNRYRPYLATGAPPAIEQLEIVRGLVDGDLDGATVVGQPFQSGHYAYVVVQPRGTTLEGERRSLEFNWTPKGEDGWGTWRLRPPSDR